MDSGASQLRTPDGVQLHLQRWPSNAAAAHGTVQIVHGLGEHIGRYAALAAVLNAAGWHVAGHDLRGHGHSEGTRGVLPPQPSLLPDVALVMDHLRSAAESGPEGGPEGPTRRHILLGHSLGGLIAARFVAEGLMHHPRPWHREVEGLVLSSPALDAGLRWPQKLLLALLQPLMPALGLSNGLQPEWICRDPDVVRRYTTDPLVHDRVTPRLVGFMVEEGAVVRRLASRWRTPTLLMWSGADRCVKPAASAAFATAAPRVVLTAHPFPGLFHEIFNEPEHAEVEARLLAWLAQPPAA